MIGLRLFLWSRRSATLLAVLAMTGVAGRALGSRGYLAGEESPLLIPWVAFLPLVCAYAVAGAVVSPLPVLELTARRPVVWISRLYVLTAAGTAVLALALATDQLPPPLSTPTAIRDFFGLLGASMIAIAFVGLGAAWIAPCGAVFMAVVLRNSDAAFAPVDWLLAPDDNRTAFIVGCALLALGIAATFSRRLKLRNVVED